MYGVVHGFTTDTMNSFRNLWRLASLAMANTINSARTVVPVSHSHWTFKFLSFLIVILGEIVTWGHCLLSIIIEWQYIRVLATDMYYFKKIVMSWFYKTQFFFIKNKNIWGILTFLVNLNKKVTKARSHWSKYLREKPEYIKKKQKTRADWYGYISKWIKLLASAVWFSGCQIYL